MTGKPNFADGGLKLFTTFLEKLSELIQACPKASYIKFRRSDGALKLVAVYDKEAISDDLYIASADDWHELASYWLPLLDIVVRRELNDIAAIEDPQSQFFEWRIHVNTDEVSSYLTRKTKTIIEKVYAAMKALDP